MLRTSSHIKNCNDCDSMDNILSRIDEYLSVNGKNASNNSKYELDIAIPSERIDKIVKYKTIILRRRFNPDYLWKVPNSNIISRINTLLNQ